jgi:hypothetical protein
MIKKLFVILLVSNCSLLYGQTIKTDVLVIGGGASGVAAAIQCARSKVKTILVIKNYDLIGGTENEMISIDANRDIPSGIWGEFRKKVQDNYKTTKGYDTTQNAVLRFEPHTGAAIIKKISDTVKNLTTYLDASFTTIKKDGDRWEVSITQNSKTITVKARVVIDATQNGDVAAKAGAKFTSGFDNYDGSSELNSYRTSIATGEALPRHSHSDKHSSTTVYPPYPAYCIPLTAVLLKNIDNIMVTEKALRGDNTLQYIPVQLTLGQGVGTVAAYCAFFKTTTTNLRVRIIQGELLDFKGYLLPFTDVSPKDPAWRAIQQVSATGMLKGVQRITSDGAKFLFNPDSLVNTAEIRPVLTEIYTRAFLWFNREKPGEKFTLGNLLSFISDYTLTDPQTLKISMQKAWKTQYKFNADFDLNRQVSRREFAVLTNKFLNPFARTVDLDGRLVN